MSCIRRPPHQSSITAATRAWSDDSAWRISTPLLVGSTELLCGDAVVIGAVAVFRLPERGGARDGDDDRSYLQGLLALRPAAVLRRDRLLCPPCLPRGHLPHEGQ